MKFIRWGLKTLPFFSILCLMAEGSHLTLSGYPLLPALFLIPLYYWTMYTPSLLPLWSLLGLGLFYDTLLKHPLGFTSLLLLGTALLAQYVRPYLTSYHFPVIWCTFCLYSLTYFFLHYLFLSGEMFPFVSWVYGILLYPSLTWIFTRLYLRLRVYG